MMRGERSYLRQRGLRRKTVFSLSCPTEGVVVINMKNILRQKVSAGIFGASLLGSLFFGGAAQAADDLTVLTSFGIIEDITRNIAGDKAKVEGMMLKLKLQSFGHLMRRVDGHESE